MVQVLIFLGGISIVVFPFIKGRRNQNFVDYYILFCLYFDIVDVFISGDTVKFIFSQYLIMLTYTLYYFIVNYAAIKRVENSIFFLTITFLLINLIIPLLHGELFKTSFIETSRVISSFSILPIAFHHYATKGRIINLVNKVIVFIIILVLAIVLFTVFRIDSNYTNADGSVWMSFKDTGSILYFGNVGVRGGFTYIGFLLLVFPLFFITKIWSRQVLIILLGFIILLMILSFKRFAFVIALIGVLVYLRSNMSLKGKFIFFINTFILSIILMLFNVQNLALQRFESRGGKVGIGLDAIENDIRFFETSYAFHEINTTMFNTIFGKQDNRMLYINTDRFSYGEWEIHNQYAQYLLKFGLLGISSYFILFIYLYRSTKKKYIFLKKTLPYSRFNSLSWLLFRAYIISFVLAGMIGGLDKITIRGLVFIFLGGIAGHFYKLVNESNLQSKHSERR